MIIYIAGPYSAPANIGRLENTRAAMRAGYKLLKKGHAPIIPHLSHWFDMEPWPEPVTYAEYLKWDLELLAKCDALLFLGSSPGADQERAFAEGFGIPVYTSIEEVPAK